MKRARLIVIAARSSDYHLRDRSATAGEYRGAGPSHAPPLSADGGIARRTHPLFREGLDDKGARSATSGQVTLGQQSIESVHYSKAGDLQFQRE